VLKKDFMSRPLNVVPLIYLTAGRLAAAGPLLELTHAH
jgi:hypothetical protein